MIAFENNTLTLEWQGPLSISDEDLFAEEKPGLYLFTVEKESFYSVQYIGMTTGPLSQRIVGTDSRPGHLRDAISGRYYLYDADKLNSLELHTQYHLNDNFKTFFGNLAKNLELARRNIEMQRFFLCPFNEFTELIPDAERLLLFHALNHPDPKSYFPILENSKGGSRPNLSASFRIRCQFPENVEIRGLMGEISLS